MTCTYTLQSGFSNAHPEITCQTSHLQTPRAGKRHHQAVGSDAWYDEHIGSLLGQLPDNPPTAKHNDLAVYWLAQTALQRLINACYDGEISLEGFVLCRDRIRYWQEAHKLVTTNPDEIEVTNHQPPRKWVSQVMNRVIRSTGG